MEVEIVEVGPSSRPLRYVPAQQRWRPTPTPLPPPPPPLPPPPAASAASSSGAGDAAAVASAANQFDSEKLPQTLVSEIRPFLRVANQIEHESPRVAYLCKSSSLLVPRPAPPCVSLVFLFFFFFFFFVPGPPATCSSKCRRRSKGNSECAWALEAWEWDGLDAFAVLRFYPRWWRMRGLTRQDRRFEVVLVPLVPAWEYSAILSRWKWWLVIRDTTPCLVICCCHASSSTYAPKIPRSERDCLAHNRREYSGVPFKGKRRDRYQMLAVYNIQCWMVSAKIHLSIIYHGRISWSLFCTEHYSATAVACVPMISWVGRLLEALRVETCGGFTSRQVKGTIVWVLK